jgi:AmmeMemoRadiSam system protein B
MIDGNEILLALSMSQVHSTSVRAPAVAGMFYPGGSRELSQALAQMLGQAAHDAPERAVPKAIIAPHAGYVYSGPVAASVYAMLAPARSRITRVVLLGPTHRVAVRGLALPGCSAFATPLGTVEIDQAAIERIRGLPQVLVSAQAHALEHSLEVHVPFLQAVIEKFTLLPLAVGIASAVEVAEVLDAVWGGPETLIVISSDLSHYLPYGDAQAVDRATAKAILGFATDLSHEQACGATPVTGLAHTARRRGLKPELIDLRNSGDTAGDKSRVVGYGSFAFYEVARDAR